MGRTKNSYAGMAGGNYSCSLWALVGLYLITNQHELKRIYTNFMIITSKALQDLFYQYTHLSLGGKEIVCPYWMNDLERDIYGPLGGKGKPEEIITAVEETAKERKIDLSLFNEEQIIEFMEINKIGVDCSGFVFWMLDVFDKESGGDGIANDIPGSQGKFIKARANVRMLTEKNISTFIESVFDIQVGDMIRLGKGKHVSIVISLKKDKNGFEILYAHSSDLTLQAGVHSAKIIVNSNSSKLELQTWEENDKNGNNYLEVAYFPEDCDGIYRLKNFTSLQ